MKIFSRGFLPSLSVSSTEAFIYFVLAWCYWLCTHTVHTTQKVAIYRACVHNAHGPFSYTMVNYHRTDQ